MGLMKFDVNKKNFVEIIIKNNYFYKVMMEI